MNHSYDCVVVGAGPAGSTVAALVAEAGFRTLLVQHQVTGSLRIGQSLMPAVRSTLARLGVLARMPESRFLPSCGWRLSDHAGENEIVLRYGDSGTGGPAYGWHLLRSEFDPLLVAAAVERGADVAGSLCVVELIVEQERVTGVRLADGDGKRHEIAARVTVDASGQRAIVARQLGLYLPSDLPRRGAVWGLYGGAKRDGAAASAGLLLQTLGKDSWFWFIPLADDVTQIGVVGRAETLLTGRGTPAEVFEDELVKCPALVERLADARLLSAFHIERDFAATSAQPAGNGWLLVGDALASADPLLSSGAFLALRSGELAAAAIVEGLKYGDTGGKQLGRWCGDFLSGANRMRRLTGALYSPFMNLAAFIHNEPEHGGALSRLLSGELFDAASDRTLEALELHTAAAESHRLPEPVRRQWTG